jgi:hypothetical protein
LAALVRMDDHRILWLSAPSGCQKRPVAADLQAGLG